MFWNKWHMTLTQWFRTYFFNPDNPLSSELIIINLDPWIIIFSHATIDHGVDRFMAWDQLEFCICGDHGMGLGLFVHNRWSTLILPKAEKIKVAWNSVSGNAFSIFFTFNFIALGWVWFALPDTK